MTRRTKRHLHVMVSPELYDRVRKERKRSGVSQAAIAETALKLFLSREIDDVRDGALIRRLDQLGRKHAALVERVEFMTELVASFVRLFLMLTPPLPPEEQEAARSSGSRRFEYFRDDLARTMDSGPRLIGDLAAAQPDDFFTEAELAALKSARTPDAARSEAPHEASHE